MALRSFVFPLRSSHVTFSGGFLGLGVSWALADSSVPGCHGGIGCCRPLLCLNKPPLTRAGGL